MKHGVLAKSLLACVLLLGANMDGAWARGHSRAHFGVVIGPMWAPYYAPRPFYYYPPYAPVMIEQVPPVYIEQTPPAVMTAPPPSEPKAYWYYCATTQAYYPYVNECPGGWMKVLPQAPSQ